MLELINKSKEVEQMKKKLFVSYHFMVRDGSSHGFGNYVGEFNSEEYTNDIEGFITELQNTIAYQLSELKGVDVEVKVLFFR